MVSPLAVALGRGDGSKPVRMVPVTVTDLSPLEVDLGDGTSLPAVGVTGLTYSLGLAVALITEGQPPLVIPTTTGA